MKKLLTILCAVYVYSLTGCATTDMTKVENDYQQKAEQARYDKMLGKPSNCQFHPTPANYYTKDGQKMSNFTYSTPTGEPCLP